MQVFLLQGNVTLLCWESLKEWFFFITYFYFWVIFWKVGRIFIPWTGNTLRAFFGLFFSNGFQSSFPVEQFILFQFYLLKKRLIFDILCKFFLLSWNNATIAEYWIYLTSSLIGFIFLSNQENLNMIHHAPDLFYDICSTTN